MYILIYLVLRLFRFLLPLLLIYLFFRVAGSTFSSTSRRTYRRNTQNQNTSSRSGSSGGGASGASAKRNRTPYEILGCSPGDSDQIIRKKYRDLVAKYHPDRFIGMNLDEEFVRLASERFSEVQNAYEELRRIRKV